ncbi:F-box domain protein [Aspergillus novofumigatus IBT 16806]|uniref:F-box domain protein n=1 Tax=Aspergillus novofumigatus (strain IBT 16806) TaxID=1392255 RepID=A0A2I1C3L1_ASPN1|nr:F-box domain protein [Aspergillus novofumigatus IBT 16806]PKX92224.1 F-box domain protein [Aspergillus novofumigatus IBT 16806]
MSAETSPFESLPNELIDQILSNLATDPPSWSRFDQPPCVRIAKSATRDLKNLSRTSSRFLEVTRPRLFAYVCFDISEGESFLQFVQKWNLCRSVTSILARGNIGSDPQDDPSWWRRILHHLDPLRITLMAPPSFIAATLGTRIMDGHNWAFQISLQELQLERTERQVAPPPVSRVETCSGLLAAREWSSLQFNESSSLKAYNHYEYFLFQVPSVFSEWGSLSRSHPERVSLSLSLNKLTAFHYAAVFPFYNHVKLVLDSVKLMTSLRSLSVRLAPCLNDKATELEQRGSMDPSDPWMELATGYTLVAHAVRDLGTKSLVHFGACDYESDALRPELSTILADVLGDSEWAHDGHGNWVRGAKCDRVSL